MLLLLRKISRLKDTSRLCGGWRTGLRFKRSPWHIESDISFTYSGKKSWQKSLKVAARGIRKSRNGNLRSRGRNAIYIDYSTYIRFSMSYTELIRDLLDQQYPNVDGTKTIIITSMQLHLLPALARPYFLRYHQLETLALNKCDLRNL